MKRRLSEFNSFIRPVDCANMAGPNLPVMPQKPASYSRLEQG